MVIASSWSCVTITQVTPTSSMMLASSICVSSRSFLSSAPSGSSSSSSCGFLARLRARATRCCWPPESWCGLRFANGAELHQLQHRLDAGARSRPRAGRRASGRRRCCRRPRDAGRARSSGTSCSSAARRAAGRRGRGRRATIEPEVGVSKPASMRSSVVLPQPEEPSRANTSPLAMSIETLSTARWPSKSLTTFRMRRNGASAMRATVTNPRLLLSQPARPLVAQ